ncbi:class I adenylate-forming enzyme family protein [Rhodoligotrophos ferricapiens]|uniref:class I adenylate-forming enzyme family protein n=1 Tax=Rhodoligotrophos ferricapiens TaxID=3069264 RepID=UPI00315D43FD
MPCSESNPCERKDADLRYTIPQLMKARAQLFPTRLALSAQSGAGRDRLTYRQLAQRMDAMAQELAALGLTRGERIGVFLTNDHGRECILTALGAFALGAVVVPFNTRASDDELTHAITLTSPRMIVTDSRSRTRMGQLAPSARLLVVDADGAGAGDAPWPEPEQQGSGAELSYADDPDTLACLHFTSGTTARSKAVMHSHRTMIAAGLCCGSALGLTADDLYQGAFPFFTSSALNIACMSCWVQGAGLILEGHLDNERRLRLIETEATSFYHGVPSVLNFMLQEYTKGGYDLRSLRRVANGGAAMPIELMRRIGEAWPWVDQVQIYGLTESGPSGTVLGPADLERKAGSVGHAMPYTEIAVVNERGEPLPPGETGEIAITGPAVAMGYYENAEATAMAFSGRRVLTGDVGRLDEDGFLFFGDRKKDVINRGGLKIASVAVESVLYTHPAVREAAVVAVPHPNLGEDVAACVVLVPGQAVDKEVLARHCAAQLADYAVPRRWLFLEALPKNPMGKVLKTELRAKMASETV